MKRFAYIFIALVFVLAALYLRPLPKIQATVDTPQLGQPTAVDLPWPGYGQAAYGAVDFGIITTDGTQKPVPIASIAKIVTAIAVVQKKPLVAGQQGPKLTISQADVDLYKKYVAEDGSVVPVNFGEDITEYQLLQGLLLPSGNNVAVTLANWAFGSEQNYVDYANNYIKSLGLTNTHIADASGFDPKTVSSAHDLVILGEKLLADPTLAKIVSQSEATIPVAGTVSNVNWLLGTDGVVGIKTGNTDQAGGCFLFAANRSINGQPIKVVGAILGAPNRDRAIGDSEPVVLATDNAFHQVNIVKEGQKIGTYKAKWGATANAIASQNLTVLAWKANNPKININLSKLSAFSSTRQKAGSVNVTVGQKTVNVDASLDQKIKAPSIFWRIFHI